MAVSHREKNAAYVEREGEDGDEDEEVEKEDPEAKARAERSEMAQLRSCLLYTSPSPRD